MNDVIVCQMTIIARNNHLTWLELTTIFNQFLFKILETKMGRSSSPSMERNSSASMETILGAKMVGFWSNSKTD